MGHHAGHQRVYNLVPKLKLPSSLGFGIDGIHTNLDLVAVHVG